jgi:hypothetical protein
MRGAADDRGRFVGLAAILAEEPEAEHFISILQDAGGRVASAKI